MRLCILSREVYNPHITPQKLTSDLPNLVFDTNGTLRPQEGFFFFFKSVLFPKSHL